MDHMSLASLSLSSHRTRASSYAPSISSGVSTTTRSSLRSSNGSSVSGRSNVTSSSALSSNSSVSSSRSDRTVVAPCAPPPSLASSMSTSSHLSRSSSLAPSDGVVAVVPRAPSSHSYAASLVPGNTTPVIPSRPGTVMASSSRGSHTGSRASGYYTPVVPPRPGSVSSRPSHRSNTDSRMSLNYTPVVPPRPGTVSSRRSYSSSHASSDYSPVIPPSPPSVSSTSTFHDNTINSYTYPWVPPVFPGCPPFHLYGSLGYEPVIPPRPRSASPPPSYRTSAEDLAFPWWIPDFSPTTVPFIPPRPGSYLGYSDFSDDGYGANSDCYFGEMSDLNESTPRPRSFRRLYSESRNSTTDFSSRESRYSSYSGCTSSHRRGYSSSRASSTIASSSAISSSATSSVSVPFIHKALFWGPDKHPKIFWDLSRSLAPFYKGRDFTAEQFATSAFTPPLSRVRIILDPHADWKFDLSVSFGEHFTVLSLLRGIADLMREPGKVPHVFWARASSSRKEAIVKAKLKRTGRSSRIRPADVPRTQVLEEEVLDGARNGSTSLLVIDLLCKEVMFAGLELYKAPDEWLLRTIKRHE